MPLTAQIAVDKATIHFDKLYTYLVPPALEEQVGPGSMVLVPFGRGRARARMGVVLAVEFSPQADSRLKTLYDAAPEAARLSPELLNLVEYLREYTFCTYYEAVKAVIPYGAQYRAEDGPAGWRLQKQLVRHTEFYYERAGRRPEKMTAKQEAAWAALAGGALPARQLEAQGISKAVLEGLCRKGVLRRARRDKASDLYMHYTPAAQSMVLSAAQQQAYDRLAALMDGTPQAALLYGVTSSGKTLVFLKLVQRALEAGRRALVLVPEISLTPQMIYRLKAHFGDRVAVQHSALSNTERLLQWQQIQAGQADIVVGTRSAVFAPLENIGLIVIDEEQEHTYHSENPPRYLAHDVAKRRAVHHGALLVMASATPATESYYAAQTGRYHLVELRKRYNEMPLPSVQLVDLRRELQEGNAGAISRALAEEIRDNLSAGQQTILLLNRRGYKTVGMCTQCGQVLKCGSCSVPMVYHKAEGRMLCHYCGASVQPVPEMCPSCGGKLKYTGFGTQRVEEELAELFPSARILRMDLDTTGRKNAHETLLRRFANGEYDIMLGTQMVAKGLDFEKVSLVGVLGIDQMLFAQGYRSFENVFSLVTQVVGRGGRAGCPGRALIQTVDPQHPVLQLAARQDYPAFYEQEIAFRRLNLYPPFCTICMVGFSGVEEAAVQHAARQFAGFLAAAARHAKDVPLRVLGPAPMNVSQVAGRYRYKLTVKCRNDRPFRSLLRSALDAYNSSGLPAKATVYVDFHSDADV